MKQSIASITILLMVLSVLVTQAQYDNKLPHLTYDDLQGKKFDFQTLKGKPLLLVYFNPTCEVCAQETESILKNINYFSDKNIVMVSPHDSMEIASFVSNYHLADYAMIKILRDPKDEFYKIFQSPGFPSLYLYDEKSSYIGSFQGYTEFEEVKSIMEGALLPTVTAGKKPGKKFPGF